VTLNELLALLGRSWSRLLIYPGGLAALAVAWLIGRLQKRASKIDDSPATTGEVSAPQRSALLTTWHTIIGALVPPWLGLALLPLPPAPGLSRQVDLIVVLALLDAPLLLAIAGEVRAGKTRRLAAALNGYPPLVLSVLALAQAAGSFEIAALARVPGDLAPSYARPLHWAGAAALILALPPVLGIGPFASAGTRHASQGREPRGQAAFFPQLRARWAAGLGTLVADPIPSGLRLRALGLVLLTALPVMAAFGALDEGGLRTIAGAAAWVLAPLGLAGLLWGYDRLAARHNARAWARAYAVFDAALLLALMGAAYQALRQRLS
jgi:hypothetical protein